MEAKEIKTILECLLFVTDKPLTINTLQTLLEEVDRRTIMELLEEMKIEYDTQGRAFQLSEIAEGYQLATRIQYAPWIRKLYKSRSATKLSRAALETLAIIAYRQPVTKAEIEDIRGVSADGVVNVLLERKIIRIVGRKEVVGRPILYGTTKEFLHYFGLKDLNDMPTLKDLQEILKGEEAGQGWELNEQGQLIVKTSAGETSDQSPGVSGTDAASQPVEEPSLSPESVAGESVSQPEIQDGSQPAGSVVDSAEASENKHRE